jgi:acetyltransferase-like isoleucine patch superfamily enzyme
MKYFSDLRGYIFLFLSRCRLGVFCFLSSAWCKTILFLRGVRYGPRNRYFGILKAKRLPMSIIKIGSHNIFRSDSSSNLIGVSHRCILSTHSKAAVIEIGNNCGFSGVTIGAHQKITIGNNVLCGANVTITDFDWHFSRYPSESRPVIIHDNVWLGFNVTVLKGVEIGCNSIIGANSLVVTSIPANVIAAGNPCKVIKSISGHGE